MKKGDIIVWQVDHKSYVAKPGARAIVQKDLLVEDEYVEVIWIRDKLSHEQMDGRYYSSYFKIEE